MSVRLVVMAKAPLEGRCKTRLAASIGAPAATRVYRLFLAETARRCAAAGLETFFCYDPPDAEDVLRDVVEPALPAARYIPQAPGDLGDRLTAAHAETCDAECAGILFLGADSPDLPDSHLSEAAELVDEHAVVLGPTPDGGMWCIGVGKKVDAKALFAGVPWSSGREREAVVANARAAGATVREAKPWADVDRAADLDGLLFRLSRGEDARSQQLLADCHAALSSRPSR